MQNATWLLALFAIGTSFPAFAQPVSFSATEIITATPAGFAGYTQAAAVADFNGDGKPDVALVTDGGPDHIQVLAVLLGNGDGTFQPGVIVSPTGKTSQTVVAADFNGDGKLDLAVPNFGGDVALFLGKGDGTFQPAISVPIGEAAAWLAAGDFNNDGKLDFAVPSPNTNRVRVLLGNGDGSFQSPAMYSVGKQPDWIVAADFNGDGKLDLATVNYGSNDVSVLLGKGDGTFGAAAAFPAGGGAFYSAAGDLNGDGKLDLAVADAGSGGLSVLLGKGDGTFQAPHAYPIGRSPNTVVIADFDGDGKMDIAVTDSQAAATAKSVALLIGNGDGTFQPPIYLDGGKSTHGVTAGDFNRDGRTDLAVTNIAQADTVDVAILINICSNTPTISSVVNGASFAPVFSASSWTTIKGANLSATQRQWGAADFVNNALPTHLDGVSVKINKIQAYVYYISATQLNVLAPDDATTGQVEIEVNNSLGVSKTFTAQKAQFTPAFFLFTTKYPAAVHISGVYVGNPGLITGASFGPAKPSETILLFGTGFGPTNPPLPADKVVTAASPTAFAVTVTIGGKPATVVFAGLSGSGLDQLNVTIPAGLPDGDAAIVATVNGVNTQADLFVTIHN